MTFYVHTASAAQSMEASLSRSISASPQITEFFATVKTQFDDPPTGQSSHEVTAQRVRCKLLHASIWPSSRQAITAKRSDTTSGIGGKRKAGAGAEHSAADKPEQGDTRISPPPAQPWSRSLPGRPGRHPYPKASRPRTAVALQRSTPRPARAL